MSVRSLSAVVAAVVVVAAAVLLGVLTAPPPPRAAESATTGTAPPTAGEDGRPAATPTASPPAQERTTPTAAPTPSDVGQRPSEPADATQAGAGPEHGADVDETVTGPTAYHAPDLGRRLRMDDLRPSGTVTTTHDGQVIERLDVSGEIRIAHDDVTVRAVRVRNTGSRYSISYVPDGDPSGATIEYVEVDGADDPDNIGVYLDRFTMRFSHVHGQSTGVRFGSGSVLEFNYVHSQALQPGSHNTAMSMHGGSGAIVRNNNLEGSTSSALSLYPRLAPLVDILVEGNLFNGGSYCTYAGGGAKEHADASRDVRFVGNRFGTAMHPECGQYGPVTNRISAPRGEWRDNTWEHNGQTVG